MERKLPKNIRQIGNVSDNPKVYVEDYVDTYIAQMCERASEGPVGAFLIGETFRKDDQDYIFIHGVVQMQDVEMQGNEVKIGDKSWKKACEEGKRHFAGNTILGWVLTAPGLQVKLNSNLIKLHEKLFMRKSRILILKDSVEKEEAFFVYKYNDLMQIGGHYIYYEKNTAMQDYMIAKRKQNCVTPSESVEDRATKDFRSIIQKKENKQKENQKHKYSYMVSGVLVLLLVGMWVSTINDYEKLMNIEVVVNDAFASIWGSEEEIEIGNEEGEETSTVVTTGALLESELNTLMEEQGVVDEAEEQEMVDETEEYKVEEDEEALEEMPIDNPIEVEEEGADNLEAQGDEATISANSTYIVEEGDSLAQICKDKYGVITRVDEVCALNGLEDSDYIYVGQEIYLPE